MPDVFLIYARDRLEYYKLGHEVSKRYTTLCQNWTNDLPKVIEREGVSTGRSQYPPPPHTHTQTQYQLLPHQPMANRVKKVIFTKNNMTCFVIYKDSLLCGLIPRILSIFFLSSIFLFLIISYSPIILFFPG